MADLTLSKRLFAIKNALAVVCGPIEVLISLLYWGLRAVSTVLNMVVAQVIIIHPHRTCSYIQSISTEYIYVYMVKLTCPSIPRSTQL